MEENISIKNKISTARCTRSVGVQEVVWSQALRTPKPGNWLSNDNDETPPCNAVSSVKTRHACTPNSLKSVTLIL